MVKKSCVKPIKQKFGVQSSIGDARKINARKKSLGLKLAGGLGFK